MNLFKDIDVTAKALDATMLRQQMITHNLANVETPGYKRHDVVFESYLEDAISKKGIKGVNREDLQIEIKQDYGSYAQRLDGNNVNVDTETAYLSQTKLKYDVLIQRANAQLQRYKYILQNIR